MGWVLLRTLRATPFRGSLRILVGPARGSVRPAEIPFDELPWSPPLIREREF